MSHRHYFTVHAQCKCLLNSAYTRCDMTLGPGQVQCCCQDLSYKLKTKTETLAPRLRLNDNELECSRASKRKSQEHKQLETPGWEEPRGERHDKDDRDDEQHRCRAQVREERALHLRRLDDDRPLCCLPIYVKLRCTNGTWCFSSRQISTNNFKSFCCLCWVELRSLDISGRLHGHRCRLFDYSTFFARAWAVHRRTMDVQVQTAYDGDYWFWEFVQPPQDISWTSKFGQRLAELIICVLLFSVPIWAASRRTLEFEVRTTTAVLPSGTSLGLMIYRVCAVFTR